MVSQAGQDGRGKIRGREPDERQDGQGRREGLRRMAAIQMVSGGDVDENLAAAARLIGEAAAQGAELVLLPEVFAVLEGGPMHDHGEPEGEGRIQRFLSEQASSHRLLLVGGTIPLSTRPGRQKGEADYEVGEGRVRASSLVFDAEGRQVARYDKIHLFDASVADQQSRYAESRSYEAGEELVTVETGFGRLGLTVCYDLRFPELYRALFHEGADLVTVPSAFTRVTGEAHWESLLRARAIENQCYVLAAGQGGVHNAKRETWGHSMIIDPWGVVLAEVTEPGEGIAVAELDRERLAEVRQRMPIAEHVKL